MSYRYHEEISLHPIVKIAYLAMLLAFVAAALGDGGDDTPFFVLLLVGLFLLAIPLVFGRLRIEVEEQSLKIRFGYLGWPKRDIPLEEIVRTEVVTYRPIRQFGGWGIRGGRFQGELTGCYSMKGNRGLLLSLENQIRVGLLRTRRLLLGTPEPEKLQQAIGP
jgi:hypothetical protein